MIEGFATETVQIVEVAKGIAESLVFVVSWLKTVVQSKAALNAVVILKRVIAANCKDPKV